MLFLCVNIICSFALYDGIMQMVNSNLCIFRLFYQERLLNTMNTNSVICIDKLSRPYLLRPSDCCFVVTFFVE